MIAYIFIAKKTTLNTKLAQLQDSKSKNALRINAQMMSTEIDNIQEIIRGLDDTIAIYTGELRATNTLLDKLGTELAACQREINIANRIIGYHKDAVRLKDASKEALLATLTTILKQGEALPNRHCGNTA